MSKKTPSPSDQQLKVWSCPVCKQTGTVKYEPSEMASRVFARIKRSHKRDSPECRAVIATAWRIG